MSNSAYDHEHILRTFAFNPQLPLRLIPPVTSILPTEATLSLTVHSPSERKSYVCTPRGVLGSLRPAGTGELFIGRQEMDECGLIVNDIVLDNGDDLTSRRHACIVYRHFLPGRREIPSEALCFLMGRHHRLGAKSAIQTLPTVLIRDIFTYLYPRKTLYLTDCGTISGTYIRAKGFLPLEIGSFVLTSHNTGFEVIQSAYSYISTRSIRVFHSREVLTGGLNTSSLLWILLLTGNPAGRMSEEGIEGFVPQCTQPVIFTDSGVSSRDMEVIHRKGRWWVKEKPTHTFGIWVCTSLSRHSTGPRYQPRWVEVNRGCCVRLSHTVISID